jgi:hypothetical protein
MFRHAVQLCGHGAIPLQDKTPEDVTEEMRTESMPEVGFELTISKIWYMKQIGATVVTGNTQTKVITGNTQKERGKKRRTDRQHGDLISFTFLSK